MPRTILDTNQFDGVQRDDLDITTSGQALIRKAVQGSGITLASTGADAGTGDVTISLNINGLTLDTSPDFAADYFVTYDASAGAHKRVLIPTPAGGRYTPTYTNVSNVASFVAKEVQYVRVGQAVSVGGLVLLTPTSTNTQTEFRMSMPFASAFTAAEQAGGVILTFGVVGWAGAVTADVANDEIYANFRVNNTGGQQTVCFSYTYYII